MTDSVKEIFDRRGIRIHRDRVVAQSKNVDFLFSKLANNLAERLKDIKRDFPIALELGCRNGLMAGELSANSKVQTLVQCDLCEQMVRHTAGLRVVADEELQCFVKNSFDLVISVASFHWVNDLPGVLIQARYSLLPGGLLLANFFGGQTLNELRYSLIAAEEEIKGGVSPRVSPFVDVRDAGDLLQRAGFVGSVSDADTLVVHYDSPLNLLEDLRGMGEVNSLVQRQKVFTSRAILFRALEIYQQEFGDESGRVLATFEIISLIGWVSD